MIPRRHLARSARRVRALLLAMAARFAVRAAATLACSLAIACGDDGGNGGSGGASGNRTVDTSSNGYCRDYYDACPDDNLRSVKLEVCERECSDGVKVAARTVRESSCWKAVCSLELGLCEEYRDDAGNAYEDALVACAKRHGWYEPLAGEE